MNKRKRRIFLSAILMIAVLSITPVFGQEPTSVETEAERSRVYMKIRTVTVTEEDPYIKSADLPTSVDVLGADQIENENVDFGMELFKNLPSSGWTKYSPGDAKSFYGSIMVEF